MKTDASASPIWLDGLGGAAAAKVTVALTRMEHANFSNAKGVGSGVYEYKIVYGPGYCLSFGKYGELVAAAQECWTDYKRRKKQEIP